MSILDRIAQRAYSSRETVQASYEIACAVIRAGIPGDFVECGVAAGANAAAMAIAILGNDRDARVPKIHLFDSFAGIPQCGPEDTEWIAAGHQPGIVAHSQAQVAANMLEWGIPDEMLVWHPGLFAETVPSMAEDFRLTNYAIALLRLDGDLYESTRVCIEHLYPLVSPGGWIIVDDFGLSGARKAVLESPLAGYPAYFQKQRS